MRRLRLALLLTWFVCLLSSIAFGQAVLTTLSLGLQQAQAAAVNPSTNMIYVSGGSGDFVTVIDGSTNNIVASISGADGSAFAVNPLTNKIYAVGYYCNCVYVIDGASNTVEATVTVGTSPAAAAANTTTNKIYVVNSGDNTVTVIDGATNNTTRVSVGQAPTALAINAITNKIYVADQNESGGVYHQGDVTVIDGATNNVQSVQVGFAPVALAVNPVTNKIYVVNQADYPGDVTVIDGATLSTTTVPVGYNASGVGVNSVTNKIYVANEFADTDNFRGSITLIDGSTNNTTTIANTPQIDGAECGAQLLTPGFCPTVVVDSQRNKVYITSDYPNVLTAVDGGSNAIMMVGTGDEPGTMAFNLTTNRIYVPNSEDSTVSVIDPSAKLQFVPLAPCRVVDTRSPDGPLGGPPIQGGASPRPFPLPQGNCNIPANALAYSLNATAVPHGRLGYLTVFSSGLVQAPPTSTLNSDGRVKANAVIVQAGVSSGVSVYASDTTDLILDVDGYFVPSTSSTLAFFPLAPCRVVDTRSPNGDLGGPPLTGGVPRSFPLLEATQCNIPSSAQAYSLNFTVVPGHQLGYLTVWPTGETQPLVSTLNDYTGTVVANAAIVPAGTNGAISAYASNDTNLIADINGYFAAPGSGSNPLSLYTLFPCRGLDTRSGRGGEFSGELVIDILENPGFCPMSTQAEGFVFNATVLPITRLQYLTLWPDGEMQPTVSTLNAYDGAVTSNMAIVPTSNQLIDAYASDLTQLLLDISAYFAP